MSTDFGEQPMSAEGSIIIDWNDSLATGIPIIDEQHKRLISLANEIFGSDIHNVHTEDIMVMIDYLADYVVMHFKEEEDLMKKYDYSGLASHKEEHSFFITKYIRLRKQCQNTDLEHLSVVQLRDLVADWLVNYHINNIDRKMAHELRKFVVGE